MKTTVTSIIQQVIAGKKYFSVDAIKVGANKIQRGINPTTINQYLYNLKIEGILYSAGRGWYSTISQEFTPSIKTVEKLALLIKNKFPLLSFSIWSTEELQPFAHHLLTQFTVFVFTDFDAMLSTSSFLQDHGFKSFRNPLKSEVEKYFEPTAKTVIVRPSITREPVNGIYATIEKILVDMFIEKDKLLLMDGAEYQRIFHNLILSQRINVARLFEYAERRKVKDAFLQKVMKQERNSILFVE